MTTWGAGDYPLMARHLEPAARAAVEVAAVGFGDRVLDVATGTGNAALLAAEKGGQVVGVDFEPVLLELAQRRAAEAGRRVRWLTGDLASLPVPDESADVVLSVFGVMYAADQAAAARELARVAASGARVVLAAWVPGSVMSAMGQVLGAYLTPPPPNSGPPSRWGDPDALAELLGPRGLQLIEVSEQRVTLQFPDAAAGAGFLMRTAGHVVSEQERLTAEGLWENLRQDLTRFVDERGERSDGRLDLQLGYLLASATKPGDGQSAIAHR
jgi:SAM-dependent methyltransferase